ncbi:MAG: M23 family metallopeptidase [Chlorobaculum sp.]|nr:M23 family metallopeptidase [Chlorobaculum sp.]
MSQPKFHLYLSKIRRSALFRKLSRARISSQTFLFVLLFSFGFFSGSLLLIATSRQSSSEQGSASPVHALFKSVGLASEDELGLNDESDKVTLNEGENDPSHRIEKRTFRKGESLYTILTTAGLTPYEVQQLAAQLRGSQALKELNVGKTYNMETGAGGKFIRFSFQPTPYETILLVKDEESGKMSALREVIDYDTRIATLEGTVHTSLAAELRSRSRESLNPKINKILSSRLDFRKEIKAGATYRILFQEQWNSKQFIGTGEVLAVEISSNGRNFNAYQFTNATGDTAYYDEKGRTMAQGRTMFIQPCRFSRVSSGFGYRVHPITGQHQFHGGVDLVAPTGTPVRAVADGRVTFRGCENGTGNLVTIAHAGGLHTMYMHLSRYAPNCRYGKIVKQGDLIGYVGSTGRSTGPHLDFRIIRNGHPQNPLVALKQNTERKSLSSAELRRFMATTRTYHDRLGSQTAVIVADAGRQADPML